MQFISFVMYALSMTQYGESTHWLELVLVQKIYKLKGFRFSLLKLLLEIRQNHYIMNKSRFLKKKLFVN